MGSVFWFTGLSGSGKTTIGKLFYEELKRVHPAIFFDGDQLREILGKSSSGYSPEERKALAFRYARLCQRVASQEIHVVCATVSMFEEVRNWNRENIPSYYEIYLKVPPDILYARNQKNLYQSPQNFPPVGFQLPFQEPKNPDIVIPNDGNESPEKICEKILKSLTGKVFYETR